MKEQSLVKYATNSFKCVEMAKIEVRNMVFVEAVDNGLVYAYNARCDSSLGSAFFSGEERIRKNVKICFNEFLRILIEQRALYARAMKLHHCLIDLTGVLSSPILSTDKTAKFPL